MLTIIPVTCSKSLLGNPLLVLQGKVGREGAMSVAMSFNKAEMCVQLPNHARGPEITNADHTCNVLAHVHTDMLLRR
jgi:hypothetical protein